MNQLEDNKPIKYFDLMGPQSIPKQNMLAGDRRFAQNDCRNQSEPSRTP